MTHGGLKHMEYIFHSLDNEDMTFIKQMPLERFLDYKGYKLYFAHYSRDDKGVVHEDMDNFREDLLDRYFSKSDADVVFFGHLHATKLIIRSKQRSYFCLNGSGFTHDNYTNWTYFDIDDKYGENFAFHRVRVKYNRAKFEKKMRDLPIPEKQHFAKKFFNLDLN